MNKTLDRNLTREQWNALQYPIILRALTEAEGGGWFATIPLLGEATCAADGDTVEEALANLEEYRRSIYQAVIASKHPIPLPVAVTEEEPKPSGKWLMRASSQLHGALQRGARESGVSFNTYCIEVLTRGLSADAAALAVREEMADLKREMMAQLGDCLRREVAGEMRVAAADIADELSYERSRAALLGADFEVEAGPDFSSVDSPYEMRLVA